MTLALLADFGGPTCAETNLTFTTEMMTTQGPTPAPCLADEDSCAGHFTCDVATGAITCLPGFRGDFCTERDFDGELKLYCCAVAGNVR